MNTSRLLARGLVASALWCALSTSSSAAPGTSSAPIVVSSVRSGASIRPPSRRCSPRGMKVRVGGEIRVTNSEDGVFDGTVEMFGNVDFNGQERWRIKRSSAQDYKKGKVILLDYMTVNVYFNDASTSFLKVTGFLRDRDIKGGDTVIKGDDAMWNVIPRDHTFYVDLKQMVDSQTTRMTLRGDEDSENANVVIIARKLADIN